MNERSVTIMHIMKSFMSTNFYFSFKELTISTKDLNNFFTTIYFKKNCVYTTCMKVFIFFFFISFLFAILFIPFRKKSINSKRIIMRLIMLNKRVDIVCLWMMFHPSRFLLLVSLASIKSFKILKTLHGATEHEWTLKEWKRNDYDWGKCSWMLEEIFELLCGLLDFCYKFWNFMNFLKNSKKILEIGIWIFFLGFFSQKTLQKFENSKN